MLALVPGEDCQSRYKTSKLMEISVSHVREKRGVYKIRIRLLSFESETGKVSLVSLLRCLCLCVPEEMEHVSPLCL